jgi:mono/diheme cytochrome c family protein
VAETNVNTSGRLWFGLALAGTLLAAATLAAYLGVRNSWAVAPRPDEKSSAPAIVDEVELPPGPHRAEFQTSCVICHSPRLALAQPTLPREKWSEVVHKMVAAYGAALSPDDEAHVVDYLVAVQSDR